MSTGRYPTNPFAGVSANPPQAPTGPAIVQPTNRFRANCAQGHASWPVPTYADACALLTHRRCQPQHVEYQDPDGTWLHCDGYGEPPLETSPRTREPAPDWGRDDWMQTFTGRAFYALNPRLDDIVIEDIAHALSMLCRYGGHSTRFYSVAEHCLLMSEAVSPENALWALLHDSTEAYMGDLIRPLKQQMPAYVTAERDLMLAICTRFGLDWDCPTEVKEADTRILLDERTALLGPSPLRWGESIETADPLGITVTGLSPYHAERLYLARFAELTA